MSELTPSTASAASTSGYTDIETGHDYDGIREFDNPLPRWWLGTLWIMVVFTFGYWIWYHGLGAPSQRERFAGEYAAWQEKLVASAMTDEEMEALLKDPEAPKRGAVIFEQNCVSCHGKKAEGLVGPNLTDPYWKHGGQPRDIYKTITLGVAGTPMQSWAPILGDAKVRDVMAFIVSLRNTNVPGPRGPEGEKME